MEVLVDDVLVSVMSRLSIEDVFSCRLVCKRLADLALHPDVWRHRSIKTEIKYGFCMCPILRLAPCLRLIWFNLLATSPHLPSETTCFVRRLDFYVGPSGVKTVVEAIRMQDKLGRLNVSVEWNDYGDDAGPKLLRRAAAMLLKQLAVTSDLVKLDLSGVDLDSSSRPIGIRHTGTPSLKTFIFSVAPGTVLFFKHMLTQHATTLEAVEFTYRYIDGLPPVFAASVSRLLAGMPNLRCLSCPLMPAMEALGSTLRDLKLIIDVRCPSTAPNIQAAADLLRSAVHLRSLHLEYTTGDDGRYDFDKELIRALVSSGRSGVESLYIEVLNTVEAFGSLPSELRRALPALPELRRLKLDLPTDELLLGIRPDTAPSLLNLELGFCFYTGSEEDVVAEWMCSHAILHSETVRALLTANPSLHVHMCAIKCLPSRINKTHPICKSCKLECLESIDNRLKSPRRSQVGAFGHPVGLCPSPQDHAPNVLWFHINDTDY